MTRLFVGTFLDSHEAARVGRFAAANQEKASALEPSRPKFLPPEKLHMTWLFLGETDAENLDKVNGWLGGQVDLLKKKFGQSLDYRLDYTKLEAWPRTNTARVLVARPECVPEAVREIGYQLSLAFEQFRRTNPSIFPAGVKEERYLDFKPHLTLVRFNSSADLSNGQLSECLSTLLPISSRITSMDLIQSRNQEGKSGYEIVSKLWSGSI